MVQSDAPSDYHVAPKIDNPALAGESASAATAIGGYRGFDEEEEGSAQKVRIRWVGKHIAVSEANIFFCSDAGDQFLGGEVREGAAT